MTELTRADIDRYLPDDAVLRRRVQMVLGFSFGSDDHMVVRGLEWLANKTEAEYTPSVSWIPSHPWEMPSPVFFTGMWFKPSWGDLAEEEWPRGESCWVTQISCGGPRVMVAGRFPALLVARTIVVMQLCVEWRSIEPGLRPMRLVDLIEAKITAGTWSVT